MDEPSKLAQAITRYEKANEVLHDKISFLEKRIDAVQEGVGNVYNEFKKILDGKTLKTIYEHEQNLEKTIIKLESLDEIVLSRTQELHREQHDLQKQINNLIDKNFRLSCEVEKLKNWKV